MIPYPEQLKKFINTLFHKKRNQLLKFSEDTEAIISFKDIMRRSDNKSDIAVKYWLNYIDYALIRSFIELDKYRELFDFLRLSKKIYCDKNPDKIEFLIILL